MDRDDRVMVFIDGSNLYHSLKTHFNRTDLDIGKFCRKLIEKKRLVRNYYYNAVVGMKQDRNATATSRHFSPAYKQYHIPNCVWGVWFTITGRPHRLMKKELT